MVSNKKSKSKCGKSEEFTLSSTTLWIQWLLSVMSKHMPYLPTHKNAALDPGVSQVSMAYIDFKVAISFQVLEQHNSLQ